MCSFGELVKQGVASALNDTTRELGGAIGVALLGAALTAAYRNAIEPELDRYPDTLATAAHEGLGRALDVSTGDPQSAGLVAAARHAFADGWSTSMWAATIAAAAMLAVLLVKNRQHLITTLGRSNTQKSTPLS